MGFQDMMTGWGASLFSWPMYLGMIVFWVALAALVIWVVKAAIGPSGPVPAGAAIGSHPETALDVLKRRYAAGEIDSTEYQRKKADIV